MTPQERALIIQFMNLVLHAEHPNFHEYPISDMRRVVNEGAAVDGSGFEGTQYDGAEYLIRAYWMNAIIHKLSTQPIGDTTRGDS